MVRAKTLGMDTALWVILPGDGKMSKARRVVYLLHPLGGDAASWMRWTSVERYAAEHSLAVIMPEVQRSFYLDMARGGRFFTYLTEELPNLVERLFGLAPEREGCFVAGASMGGYGAMKAILSRPDLYARSACFSGAYDLNMVKALALPTPGGLRELMGALGDNLEVAPENNLTELARQAVSARPSPKMMMCCGESDFLLGANLRMYKELSDLGLDVRYRQWPGGHSFDFWDEALPYAFDFFAGKEPPEKITGCR